MSKSLSWFMFGACFVTFSGCGVTIPDPCTLVTIEEVRAIAPDVTYSKPVDPASFKEMGDVAEGASIKTCVWRNASNKDQVLLTSKAAGSDSVEPALRKLFNPSHAKVVAVPSIGPDAAAAFYGSGEGEILAILAAQNEKIFLDM